MYAKILALAGVVALASAQSAPPSYGSASDPAPTSSTSVAPPSYGSSSTDPASPTTAAPYWSGSVSPTPSTTSAPIPSSSAYPACWASCFSEAGITSESQLCGNTEVDACIQANCTAAEDQAYWTWYEAYCPASSTTTAPATTSSAVVSPTGAPSCWDSCFAANNITSEASLCGNTAVDACIQQTCSAAEDQAYWAWYESYCNVPASTSVVTVPCSTYVSGAATITAYETSAVAVAPYPTGAATGAWGSSAAAAGTGAAWGTGAAAASATAAWGVPATGAGVVNKPGAVLAAIAFVAALL